MTLTVWVPPQAHRSYCIGVDTAEGLGHGDFSVIQVLDSVAREQVACYHARIAPDLLAGQCYALGMWYNRALVGVEANNHGLTTITELRRQGYPHQYKRMTLNATFNQQTQEYGWKTTRTSKPLMIDDLEKAIRLGELTVNDEYTIAELKTYTRDDNGRMSGSPHDDRVMALAVALQMVKFAFAGGKDPDRIPEFSVDWWADQLPAKPKSKAMGYFNSRT